MRILIVTSGSRGDTQPYIALGLELQSRGHDVVIAVETRLEGLVKGAGLKHHAVPGDPTAMLWEKESQAMLRDGKVMQLLANTAKLNEQFFAASLDAIAAAVDNADLVVTAALTLTQTLCAAQARGVAWVPVILGPTIVTGAFPVWLLSRKSLWTRWLNRATYQFLFWMLWRQEKPKMNAWRTSKLGLPALVQGPLHVMEQLQVPVVVACSRFLIPGLKVPEDYPSYTHVTGSMFVPDTPTEDVDPLLRGFVEAGEPPMYLGFGSMPAPEPRVLLQLVADLVAATGRRAVLCAGWSELDSTVGTGPDQVALPEDAVLVVAEAPHDWLFPRCCVIVHHAGIGTCAAALRSGTPSAPCPVMLDQPWNAERLVEAGVAAPPIPFQKLTAGALAAAVGAVLNDAAMAARAAEVAAEMAGQCGRAAAADVVLAATARWELLDGKA